MTYRLLCCIPSGDYSNCIKTFKPYRMNIHDFGYNPQMFWNYFIKWSILRDFAIFIIELDLCLHTPSNVNALYVHVYASSCDIGPCLENTWWRHQMEMFSALLALCEGNPPVTGGLPSQRPVTQNFDVFFDVRRYKRLSKQSRRRWF